jgi:hypothetical protein
MKLTRREDISVYLYLKDIVVGPQYSEISTGMSLTQASSGIWSMEYDEELEKFPFQRDDQTGLGRGLLYFDYIGDTCLFGVEQSSLVRVYDGSITASGYSINYLTGQILSNEDLSGHVVDYEWNYVAVTDAWPYDDVPPLPIVSVEVQRGSSLPLQLGGGDIREGSWSIEIFANNKGERDDLLDTLYEAVYQRRCSLFALPSGLPLRQNGLYNSHFNSDLDTEYSSLFFERVEKKFTSLPKWGFYGQERINRHRAQLTFDTQTYRN